MRSVSATTVSAWTSHALAWAAGVWLAFGPIYHGVSATPVLPGESGGEVTRFTATLIEVNGLQVILLLIVPVLLTGIALVAVQLLDAKRTGRKILLWVSAVVLLGFCAVGIFSIGMFYLPAALALLVGAITGSTRQTTAP